jgi:hypothetical protein
MRAADFDLACAVRDHWLNVPGRNREICPAMLDLDGFLAFLDQQGIKPGHAIMVCPACGQHHRWSLLREILTWALGIQPRRTSPLLEMIDRSLDGEREQSGGEEGRRQHKKEAEQYFSKIGILNRDKP